MLFNSLAFLLFTIVVFSVYWSLRKREWQNTFLLIASYVFYGWWDWRFLFLIASCSAVNFICGKIIYLTSNNFKRKICLAFCCVICLGELCYFKYANFFLDSLVHLIRIFNPHFVQHLTLKILLPVGISFFTFQALSYTIDVYLGKLHPTDSWIEFFVFISFFPQLVAGPIERATNLLPQFQVERKFDFDNATNGLCLVAYGLFKKMVVADTLALYVDKVFNMPEFYNSISCILAAFFFSIQIYCDFSGYSDCARGIARLFGFEMMLNFNRPYLADSFVDFWRRWHISLSTWFKDYVYIPLGGNRVGLLKHLRNVWIVFLLSGLWHGAAWNFIIWGGIHALYQSIDIFRQRYLGIRHTFINKIIVFVFVTLAWIIFRARGFDNLKGFWVTLCLGGFKLTPTVIFASLGPMTFLYCWIAIGLLALSYLCPPDCRFKSLTGRYLFTIACSAAIVFIGMPSGGEFIYFQF